MTTEGGEFFCRDCDGMMDKCTESHPFLLRESVCSKERERERRTINVSTNLVISYLRGALVRAVTPL